MERCKVYKIVNSENSKVYVGSTIRSLNKRFLDHKSRCRLNTKKGCLLYKEMREIGMEKFKIELIRECEKEVMLQYEKEEIKKIEPDLSLNLLSPLQTKEELEDYHRRYNKEKINCECGSIVRKRDILTHRKTKKHQNFLNINSVNST